MTEVNGARHNANGRNWSIGPQAGAGGGVGSARGSEASTERDYASNGLPDSGGHSSSNGIGAAQPDARTLGTLEDRTADAVPQSSYWSSKRHLTCGNPTPLPAWVPRVSPRRAAPGKLKTVTAALVLCLNIDVDPPDVVKTNPCAYLECWVDPHTMPSHKALEAIGTNLQHQFEGLSPKLNYKPILDPSYEDLRRFCLQMRKTAKEDTALFYYNGHGVPKPTASGELWCFNRNYTQYIPVGLHEIQSWLSSPCIYIWDCSAAGHLLQNFKTFADRRDTEANMQRGGHPEGVAPFMDSIQLAACAAHESLPSCPELPADVFTSCLTSPIDIALRFFVMTHQLPDEISGEMVMQLPGDLKDRRTPLGELNWIFTAITDTIAWTTFSRDVFARLYRSDLLIASLFRNFLLAERIMKNYHCTPHTHPPLPPTNTHPLWASWDLAVDACLRQLPGLLGKANVTEAPVLSSAARSRRTNSQRPDAGAGPTEVPYQYIPSRFFADQLTAFEVWISRGGSALTKRSQMSMPLPPAGENGVALSNGSPSLPPPDSISKNAEDQLLPRKPPEQLPIVLQVLLSQPHRLRALILLSQFVELGPWAVHLALNIGIFPYISKLLQAAGQELRPVLIFIWARILAVDASAQLELYSNQGYKYFATVLAMQEEPRNMVIPNKSEHKAMCAFILSAIARDYAHAQNACWREKVFDHCRDLLDEEDFLLRQWSALCIAQLWASNEEIRVYGVDTGTQDKLLSMLSDDSAEVRAAVLYALGTFLGASGSADPEKLGGGGSGTMYQLEERIHFRMEVAVATGAALAVKDDASPMVRKELLVVISCLVKEWRGYFVICAWMHLEEDERRQSGHVLGPEEEDISTQALADWLEQFGDDDMLREENRVLLSSFFTIFAVLLVLSADAYPEVATNARTIVDYAMALLFDSPFAKIDCTAIQAVIAQSIRAASPQQSIQQQVQVNGQGRRSRAPSLTGTDAGRTASPARPQIKRADTMTEAITSAASSTMRRTSSFANVLRSLAGGIAFPSTDDTSSVAATKRESLDLSRPPSPNLNFAKYTSPYSRPPSPTSVGQYSLPPSYDKDSESHGLAYSPSDVMEALVEEDIQRLRARRRFARHSDRAGVGGGMASPNGSMTSSDSNGGVILGLGTGVGIGDILPLKSRFFDWCAEYFKEPQMRQAEADEPGSVQYNYQVWRQQRTEQINLETMAQADVADNYPWDLGVRTLSVSCVPLVMAFHAYDNHLVIADDSDNISVWDWSRKKRLNKWANGGPRGASVTALHIINQDVGGMILTGSADGVVRLYRDYDGSEQSPVQLVSAFRGLTEMVAMDRGSGMVLDWSQQGGALLAGGDARMIRHWDAYIENQVFDFDTNAESPVTSIVSDPTVNSMFLAGFADGVVKVFDRRMQEEDAITRSYRSHSSWVQNVRWHSHLGGQFLSASLDGQVKLWDLRGSGAAVETWEISPNGLSSFDVHSLAGVFAATSAVNANQWRHQRTVVHSLAQYNPLSTVSIPTGLGNAPSRKPPSNFNPSWSSTVFHPTEMLYGVSGPDGTVRILGCKMSQ